MVGSLVVVGDTLGCLSVLGASEAATMEERLGDMLGRLDDASMGASLD